MGHQTLHPNMGGSLNGLGDFIGIFTSTQPAHATVDLKMVSSHFAPARGQSIPCGHVVDRVKHRRQIVVEQAFALGRQEVRHHQNARRDSGISKRRPFLHITHGQPARARSHQYL